MIRRIIHIDQDKCNGCGACARACHEGAIDMVDGKAKLMREHYCDGLGDCLPACPTGAITFEEREAPAYDEAAVKAAQAARNRPHTGCPGAAIRQLAHKKPAAPAPGRETESQLTNWPVQIKLVPTRAPYFEGGAADRGGLHGLHLCRLPQPVPGGTGVPHRLPQAGRRGLHREAGGDPPQQQHPLRDGAADGGALLRRAGDGRPAGPGAVRPGPALAGVHRPHRRHGDEKLKRKRPGSAGALLCTCGARRA